MIRNIHYLLLLLCFMGIGACTKNQLPPSLQQHSDYREKAQKLYARGNDYLGNGNDSLKSIADRLIRLGNQHEDTVIIVHGNMLKANYAWRKSNYPLAIKFALKALSGAQSIGLRRELPTIYSTIGNLYKENENYPSAISLAKKSVAVSRELKDTSALIATLLNLGMFVHSYSMLKDNDKDLEQKSLAIYLKGLALAESNSKYERARIPFYDNLSQYYKITGAYEKGIYYGKKGVALAKKYNQKISLTYSYNWLGVIYFNQGNQQKGLNYLQRALQAAKVIHNVYREMEIYRSLSKCYHAIGNDTKALSCFSQAVTIDDSLRAEENVKQIGLLHIQYETGRKDQKIASLDAINKEKTKRNRISLIGLSLFILLSVFLFFQYRAIRKRNRQLDASYQKINEQSQKLQMLMKELHHRVKNNLQIVSSLLSLQSGHLKDEDARQAMKIGQQRIEAMSLIHRSLYQQQHPNMVNMQEYITDLVESILQTFGYHIDQVDLHIDIGIKEMDVDRAMPLGLIINEWVTNAFKHAYKNIQRPALTLSLVEKEEIVLQIKDNGPGMNRNSWEKPQGSFGIKLVKVLSKQLGGICKMSNKEGTVFNLNLPQKLRQTG